MGLVGADTFANNHLSIWLLSTNPLTDFGLHMCVSLCSTGIFTHDNRTDEAFKAASTLSDNLNNPAISSSTLPQDSAFSRYFNINGSIFDYFAGVSSYYYRHILLIINDLVPQPSPDQIRRRKRFGSSMIGLGAAIEADAVVYGKA